MAWRWRHVRRAVRERDLYAPGLGWPAFLTMAAAPLLGRLAGDRLRRVKVRGYRHPVYLRPGTSDLNVARQVFALDEYACVAVEPDVRFVVDLGANVGLATFYLLHRYPAARAVVVEPDPGNMAVCRRTLAPFGSRVTFVEAGVWSASAPMVVDRGRFRDGAEWSFQVRPAGPGERPDFRAVTVGEVLDRAGFPRADLLKMDIEAAEAEVFRTGADRWLPRVRTMVVELHGPDCEAAVAGALSEYRYERESNGSELTVYRDIRLSLPGRRLVPSPFVGEGSGGGVGSP